MTTRLRGLAVRAVALVALAGSSSACSGGPEPGRVDRPPRSDAAPGLPAQSAGKLTDSGRTALVALTAPMTLDGMRWARGNLPRDVPEPDVVLPSLIDDPPGRALVASYVPRPATGFDGEAIEFYGVDGRWRRLDLGDLDLPEDGWSGTDTYGAGALSPNGRWWAGPMQGGMFMLDLRDGSATTLRVGNTVGHASVSWAPDSDELVLILVARSRRVSVPGLAVEPFPHPKAYPKLLADGGWVECEAQRHLVDRCSTYARDGALVADREVPDDLRRKWAGPWASPLEEATGSRFYSLPGSAYGNLRKDSEVVRTDADFRADARLVLPAGSNVNSIGSAINRTTLGLAALRHRTLLAWLVDEQTIVRVLRPGTGLPGTSQDFWDVSYARDLVRIR